MKRKIFDSVLMVTALTAMITVISLMFLFFPFMENEILKELQEEGKLIEKGIDMLGDSYLNQLSGKERRITLINTDGTVVFDSGTDVDVLDNHLNRDEVKQAIEKGEGSSIRLSNTLTKRTLNYAKRIEDGRVLRISVNQNYILALFSWLITPTLIIIAAVTFLSAFLAGKVSDNVLQPLYELDPEKPEDTKIYEEIKPLTQKIIAQNRKLKKKVYEEIKEKQKKQNEFTTNMTHELKTPLTSISGFAELMMNGGMDEETVKDFARSIYDETARLIDLVNEIIKIAEMEERTEEYQFTQVDLLAVTKEVKSRLEFSAEKKNIQISISGDKANVYGEENIIYEMIYNLCDNAIKYNVFGGRVGITIEEKENSVVFTVSDSGIGIPKEEQGRIFERFYMVNKSHSKEVGGTGLGLSIVHQGAMLHNARIGITSEEKQGTKIFLEFPNVSTIGA